MGVLQIVLDFETIDDINKEFESNLRNGGAFVAATAGVQTGDKCEVVLVHPDNGEKKTIPAMVTLIVDQGDNKGMGLALNDFNPTEREAIRRFIDENAGQKKAADPNKNTADRSRYNLSESERTSIAHRGDVGQRIQLERRYGKLVWETLLRNPRITRQEVGRIAKKANLPANLRQLIISNRAWIADMQVRRALLTNPKLTQAEIKKILKAATRNELRVLSKQGASLPRIRKEALNLLVGV